MSGLPNSPAAGPGRRAACVREMRLFFIALQFFTRVPIPRWVGYEPAWLQQSSRYYPLVGLVVGAVTAAVYASTATVVPQGVAVVLSVIAGIYLTGAFHEDGFADVCDGFGGGYTPQRVIDIMKDSRVGAYGAIGICLMVLLKCATLASLPAVAVVPALVLGHPLSRLLSAALIWRLDYVKDDGKAKPLARHMSTREFLIAGATGGIPLILVTTAGWLAGYAVLTGLAMATLAAWWLSRFFVRRIGGFTGDCLGAVQQLAEVAFYLGVLACMGGGAFS